MDNLAQKSAVVGRVLIGAVFLMSGLSKLATPDAIQGYIASVGLPFPFLGYVVALVAEIGLGALLIAGYRARWVASLLALFTLATAVFFHNNFADQNQMIHFLKNMMVIGGLLQIAAIGATSPSVDARRVTATKLV